MPGGDDLSMFETVQKQGEQLGEHGQILNVYGKRIDVLEKSDEDIMRELRGMKTDFTNLENTIWKTAQSTQDLMTSQNKQQWKLIDALNNGNQEEKARKHDIAKTKMEKGWEFAGKLAALLLGSGSVLYVLLEIASK